ncbi:MAG: DNA-binding protein, partial [Nitrososphaeraceae archaeon]
MSNHISGYSKVVHIGFDDTDSAEGRCTTNLAFKTISKLTSETDSKFIDYPLLVRLNPNIPWKTRGNGAICLRI